MRARPVWAILAAWLVALPCLAGDQLSIRLVKASNSDRGSSAGLQDVFAKLAKSLPYKHYSLVASGSLRLPAKKAVQQLGEYTVRCDGKQSELSITVQRKGKQVLRKTANLPDGTHLIVGGFPTAGGKLILVFVAR